MGDLTPFFSAAAVRIHALSARSMHSFQQEIYIRQPAHAEVTLGRWEKVSDLDLGTPIAVEHSQIFLRSRSSPRVRGNRVVCGRMDPVATEPAFPPHRRGWTSPL